MKCPYCAEEIKDEATFCRYCRHDLAFYKPISERLSSIEKQVSENKNSIEDLKSMSQPAEENHLQKKIKMIPCRYSVLAVLLPILVSIVSFIFYAIYPSSSSSLILIALFSPLPFGLWLGITMPEKNLRTFVLLGFIIGTITSLGIFIVDSLSYGYGFHIDDLIIAFVIFGIGAILLFTVGGFIGDWIKRIHLISTKPRYFERIARHLHKGISDEQVELLGKILSGILAFLAVIIPAYLASPYLASQVNVQASLKPGIGNITVDSDPQSWIYLDANQTPVGYTPYTIKDIPTGSHQITLKLDGYQDWSESVNVTVGGTSPVNGGQKVSLLPEGAFPEDTILNYHIINHLETNLTIEVIYTYNILHGKDVYVYARLIDSLGTVIGETNYTSQVPTVGNGTATVKLELRDYLYRSYTYYLQIGMYEENRTYFVIKSFRYFRATWARYDRRNGTALI